MEDVRAGYGKMEILHGVSLVVRLQEIVSVIGPNGAGKSTAFKTIVGLLHPWSGRILFAGDITGLSLPGGPPRAGLCSGVDRVPQMTVLENLEMEFTSRPGLPGWGGMGQSTPFAILAAKAPLAAA
jgi:branched-chain amino acid transport system ATP-binding protein